MEELYVRGACGAYFFDRPDQISARTSTNGMVLTVFPHAMRHCVRPKDSLGRDAMALLFRKESGLQCPACLLVENRPNSPGLTDYDHRIILRLFPTVEAPFLRNMETVRVRSPNSRESVCLYYQISVARLPQGKFSQLLLRDINIKPASPVSFCLTSSRQDLPCLV